MCGFAGIVDFSSDVDLDRVLRMSERIAHRGPDDHGYYSEPGVAFAGLRLAIIDLSSVGRQPMADATGRYRLLFNGDQ